MYVINDPPCNSVYAAKRLNKRSLSLLPPGIIIIIIIIIICVSINNFIKTLKREGEELIESIVYHSQYQQQKQKQKTIEISRIVPLQGLGSHVKTFAPKLGLLASCNTGLKLISIKHQANLAEQAHPAFNAQLINYLNPKKRSS